MSAALANFGNLWGVDGLLILAVGLLIFGRRLPEVGRNLMHSVGPDATPAESATLGTMFVIALSLLWAALAGALR